MSSTLPCFKPTPVQIDLVVTDAAGRSSRNLKKNKLRGELRDKEPEATWILLGPEGSDLSEQTDNCVSMWQTVVSCVNVF